MAEIEVRGLTKIFGAATAVRDVSFTTPAGQVTGFLGPNGLPFYASEALDRAAITATRLLPQWGGGLVLLGYAAVFAAAVLVTLRRDVT